MTIIAKFLETTVILWSLQLTGVTIYASAQNLHDIVASTYDTFENKDVEPIDDRRPRSTTPIIDDTIARETKFSRLYRETGSMRVQLYVHCYGVSIRTIFDDCDDLANFTRSAAASWFPSQYEHRVTIVSIVDRTRSIRENDERYGVDVHFFDDDRDHEASGHRPLPSYVVAHANENFVHVNMQLVLKYDPNNRRSQLQRILTHEFGHCFGLRDTYDPASIMSHVNLLHRQSQSDYLTIATLFEPHSEHKLVRSQLYNDRYPWYLLFA